MNLKKKHHYLHVSSKLVQAYVANLTALLSDAELQGLLLQFLTGDAYCGVQSDAAQCRAW